jgi:hypothetical protein
MKTTVNIIRKTKTANLFPVRILAKDSTGKVTEYKRL